MPVSLRTASEYHDRERFLVWDPVTGSFGRALAGRKKRIDPFVSLWHRSSRRGNIFIREGQDVTGVSVLRHEITGDCFLVSQTQEQDAWLDGDRYNWMLRVQRSSPPSGGQATLVSPRVSGSGDNLGAVSLTSSVIYTDIEFRSTSSPEATVNAEMGEYLVFCSNNLTPQRGDFVLFGGEHYRSNEWFYDAGFRCSRATREGPRFVTATFFLLGSLAPVYDPSTGTFSSGSTVSREVSVQIGVSHARGGPTEDQERIVDIYIDVRHVGFVPFLGQRLTANSVQYVVTSVSMTDDNLQWKLEATQ